MSRVWVLGNAAMDFGVAVPRLPVAGETLVGRDPQRAPGGKGLNQAAVAARAGARVRFLAPLGRDAEADEVAAALAGEPFEALDLPRLAGPTDRSVLMVLPDGENCIVSSGGCADALDPAVAERFAAGCAADAMLLMQGNLSFAATLAAARASGGRVMLNTAPLCWDVRALLPLCAVVVANAVEAAAITGSVRAAALRDAGAGLAVVTLGAGGCCWADASGERALPAAAARAVDSTGAGDAFCGVLAALLAQGWASEAAIAVAQRAAARTVERRGAFAALPTAAELARLVGSGATGRSWV